MNAPGPKPPIVVNVSAGSIAFYPDAALGGHTRVRVFVGTGESRRPAGELTLRNDELAILDGLRKPPVPVRLTPASGDYVVIRPSPDLPPGFLPPRYDGLWLDRVRMPQIIRDDPNATVALASGRFEMRDDGDVAEVYEVRP